MKAKYEIIRSPLSEDFDLPSREELLKVMPGDMVKIMFKVGEDAVERMWVIVVQQQDISEWTGILDSDPVGEETKKVLHPGDEVLFHPLDIIKLWEENNRHKNIQYLKEKYGITIE